MDAEAGTKSLAKPSACGGSLVKAIVVGSVIATFGILGILVGLHLSGNLTSSPSSPPPKDEVEEISSAMSLGQMGGKINEVHGKKNNPAPFNIDLAKAIAVSAMAEGSLGDSIQDMAEQMKGVMGADGDMASNFESKDIPDFNEADTINDFVGAADGLENRLGEGIEMDGGLGEAGDNHMGDILGDPMENHGEADFGDVPSFGEAPDGLAEMGESEGSLEGVEGMGEGLGHIGGVLNEAFEGSDNLDFGDMFGDMGDSIVPFMAMSSLMRNKAAGSPLIAQKGSQQQVNPFALAMASADGFFADGFK